MKQRQPSKKRHWMLWGEKKGHTFTKFYCGDGVTMKPEKELASFSAEFDIHESEINYFQLEGQVLPFATLVKRLTGDVDNAKGIRPANPEAVRQPGANQREKGSRTDWVD